jgi:hypothetical protein
MSASAWLCCRERQGNVLICPSVADCSVVCIDAYLLLNVLRHPVPPYCVMYDTVLRRLSSFLMFAWGRLCGAECSKHERIDFVCVM